MNANTEQKIEQYIDRVEKEAQREGLEKMVQELRKNAPKPTTIPGLTIPGAEKK